jgi:CARDB
MFPIQPLHRALRPAVLAAAALVWASPGLADVDLVVQSVQWVAGPKVGNCNKLRITVRNAGSDLGNEITAAKVRIFPTSNSFQTLVDKNVFFSAFPAGQSQVREISNLELPAAVVTIQVTADADPPNGAGKLAESNENNNTSTQTGIDVSEACGGGLCDLQATFNTGPTTLPATYPANLSVTFKNIGGASCPSKQVTMMRFNGSSASGSGSAVGTQSLQALTPGQQKNLGWSDSNHPSSGTVTYQPAYGGGLSDANNGNHSPARTVTFSSPPAPGSGGGSQNGCDLKATFTAPPGSTAAAGNVVFSVYFKNHGSSPCKANKIKLLRFNSGRCGGYSSQVGGSGAFQALPGLSSGQPTTLSWTDKNLGRGRYCYAIKYSSPHNDDDNSNHLPQKNLSVN